MAIDFEQVPTTCYLLDETLFRKNLEVIKEVKDKAGIDIILAFKGFSMWGVFPIVREYISSAAASSYNEARLAAEEMKSLAHTYSPGFSAIDFDGIIEYSSHITFNSITQFNTFYPFIKRSGKKRSVGLRVNPEYSEVATDLYNPCAPGSRLGITASQLGDILPEGVEGLHFHALCESTSYTLEKTLKAFEEKFGRFLPQIKWVNMGGGHLMTHKDYDKNHLIQLLKTFREKHKVSVILEPGSAFAWETGYLVSSVLDIVEREGIKTAILDVSFTAHMPDCLEMPYQPQIIGATTNGSEGFVYRLGGNSCLAGDYMGNWSFKKELKEGDKIIFCDMIHYTMVKTSMFNGVNHPSIALWTKSGKYQLIKEFSYEDYKNKLS